MIETRDLWLFLPYISSRTVGEESCIPEQNEVSQYHCSVAAISWSFFSMPELTVPQLTTRTFTMPSACLKQMRCSIFLVIVSLPDLLLPTRNMLLFVFGKEST